jgi:hypothetical protein
MVDALRKSRLNFQKFDLSSGSELPNLREYICVLLAAGSHHKLDESSVQRLTDYLAQGGGLVIAFGTAEAPAAKLVGLRTPLQCVAEEIRRPVDITFEAELLPGLSGIAVRKNIRLSAPDLLAESVILVRSSEGVPIAWQHTVGGGRAVVWQSDLLESRSSQGIVVASIMNVQPITVHPIANVGVVQIDDFPAAAATSKYQPIEDEYDLTLLDFYDQVWLPDMLELAERYGIPYTFLAVFNYNARIRPPFDFDEWTHGRRTAGSGSELFSVFASRLVSEKHELGLHGYNHVSLRSSLWGSKEDMLSAMRAAADRWRADELGPLPRTYVPPDNSYDAAGLEAVTQAFNSIRIIAGHSDVEFESGGDRDFGPEPWNSDLYWMPRVTDGYFLGDAEKLKMIFQLALMGVWTHSLHPDDVIDTPENRPTSPRVRNPEALPWRGDRSGRQDGLYYQIDEWLAYAASNYPWLRFMRTEDAEIALRGHQERKFEVRVDSDQIAIEVEDTTFFQVRLNAYRQLDLECVQGAELVDQRQFADCCIWTFRSEDKQIGIGLVSV